MPDKRPPPANSWLLRRADQAVVGILALSAIVAMGVWWIVQGGPGGRLIEFEQLPQRTAQFTVDINAAEWPEVAQVPGIGESLARRIVELRGEQGPYADHQELLRVRGIGPRTLERMKPFLRPLPETGNVAGN